jgi:hypothetical protein
MYKNYVFCTILLNKQNESLKKLIIPNGFFNITDADAAFKYATDVFSNNWSIGTVTCERTNTKIDKLILEDI